MPSVPTQPAAGGVGQPAAVLRSTVVPAPPPSNLGAEAIAATAGGAITGAVSADATARARLQRLVEAVARQQPRLAWAAGDRADRSTVLVTDLASGWIPPGVDLPIGVTLLDPAPRRGDLQTLLGEVNATVQWTPGHYLADDDEPLRYSPRPRHGVTIDELGWELSQATRWRDGLPRLAHTLAKAAWSGTGVLDSELDQLHESLTAIATAVVDNYPGDVDPEQLGNWQLLAAIDALIVGDKSAANYHLAWFQACATTGRSS
jgi:hypothetical protein